MALTDYNLSEITQHLFDTFTENEVLSGIVSANYSNFKGLKNAVQTLDDKERADNDDYSASEFDYDFEELEDALNGISVTKESHQIITAPVKRIVSTNSLTEEHVYKYVPVTFSVDDIRRYEPDPNSSERTLVYTKGESKPEVIALPFSDFTTLYVGGSTGTRTIYKPGGQARVTAYEAKLAANTATSKATVDAGHGQFDAYFTHEEASKLGIDGYMLPYMSNMPKSDFATYGFSKAYGLDNDGNRVNTYTANPDWKFGDGNGELRLMITGSNVPAVGEIIELVRDFNGTQELPKAEDFSMYGVGVDGGRGETSVDFSTVYSDLLGFTEQTIQEADEWTVAQQINFGFDYVYAYDSTGKTTDIYPLSTLDLTFINNIPRQVKLQFPDNTVIGKNIRFQKKYDSAPIVPIEPPTLVEASGTYDDANGWAVFTSDQRDILEMTPALVTNADSGWTAQQYIDAGYTNVTSHDPSTDALKATYPFDGGDTYFGLGNNAGDLVIYFDVATPDSGDIVKISRNIEGTYPSI